MSVENDIDSYRRNFLEIIVPASRPAKMDGRNWVAVTLPLSAGEEARDILQGIVDALPERDKYFASDDETGPVLIASERFFSIKKRMETLGRNGRKDHPGIADHESGGRE